MWISKWKQTVPLLQDSELKAEISTFPKLFPPVASVYLCISRLKLCFYCFPSPGIFPMVLEKGLCLNPPRTKNPLKFFNLPSQIHFFLGGGGGSEPEFFVTCNRGSFRRARVRSTANFAVDIFLVTFLLKSFFCAFTLNPLLQ